MPIPSLMGERWPDPTIGREWCPHPSLELNGLMEKIEKIELIE